MSPGASMHAAAPPRRSSGFTLIEVLVAVAIMGILLTTIYGAVSRTMRSKEHAESSARITSLGREALLRIADEIEASLSPTYAATAPFQGVGNGGAQPLDQVRFAVSSRPPFGPIGGTSRGGRVLITYYLVEQEGVPNSYLLVRGERALPKSNWSDEEEQAAQEQELRTLVTENVAGLRFRYLDGDSGQWADNWDNTPGSGPLEGHLPIAVEVALFLYDDNGVVNDFSTVVDLPLAPKATPTP